MDGEIAAGTKINLLISDDTWESGTFLGIVQECGNEYYLLDQGGAKPTKINGGFVMKVLEDAPAEVIKFPRHLAQVTL